MTSRTASASSPTPDQPGKRHGWNLLGGDFWRLGRKTAKPSAREVDLYLANPPGQRLCVIGASTRDLVEASIARGFAVTVVDFSAVMGKDLADDLGAGRFSFVTADILHESALIEGQFDLIIADRLVNRFIRSDLPLFAANVHSLLSPGGELRTSVKLGLYPMDERLIESGRDAGTLASFYDEATRTLDYAAARPILEKIKVEHGEIPRETLIEWYVCRGRESRFEAADISAGFQSQQGWEIARQTLLPDAPDTMLWVLRRNAGEELA